ARPRAARVPAAPRVVRAGRPSGPAWLGARECRAVRDRVGARPRQLRRLGLARDRRLNGGRSRRARAVRALGASGADADAADAVLPQPRVHAHERRIAFHVLRDVRLDLPARAVLPDGAGLLAARGWDPDPAV